MNIDDIRVYAVNIYSYDIIGEINLLECSDEHFISLAEQMGLVWTLKGFQKDFNDDNIIAQALFIRILNKNEY
jgi:hypothetical protein